MSTEKRNEAFREALINLNKQFPIQGPQCAVDHASALIVSGLAYSDIAQEIGSGEELLETSDAEDLKNGLMYFIIPGLPNEDDVTKRFFDSLHLIITNRFGAMKPEELSDLTKEIATFAADVAATTINFVLPASLKQEDVDDIAKRLAIGFTKLMIQETIGAMGTYLSNEIAAKKAEATSEQSQSQTV